jgi:carboxymethylenebutenolidase
MAHQQAQGFLATSEKGKGPGLLVLHPWWGLNETVKTLCRRLAAEGFTTFAPDLFHGKVAATIKEAEALIGEFEGPGVMSDIADAVDLLSKRPDLTSPSIGVVGLSFGANYALDLSIEDPDRVRAVVLFYGTGGGDFSPSRATYLGHFAEADPYEPLSGVKSLEETIRAAGRPVTFHTYPGTGHWFFEQDRSDAYNEAASKLAWERTVGFLKESLVKSTIHA